MAGAVFSLELPIHDEDDDDAQQFSAIDVACPIGQQLIGALFGFLLAYIGFLIVGESKVVLSVLLAFGTSFGTLAAAVTDPFDIFLIELLAHFSIAGVLCLLSFYVLGCGSMLLLILVSVLVSGMLSAVRSFCQLFGYFKIKARNVPRANERFHV